MYIRNLIFLLLFAGDAVHAQPVGLQNQGATCYGNSVVQCLYNIQPITDLLLPKYDKNEYPDESIAKKYVDLLHAMSTLQKMPSRDSAEYKTAQEKFWDTELRAFTTRLAQIMNPDGGGYRQEDAPEFFGKLIVNLMEENPWASEDADQGFLQDLRAKHPIRNVIRINAPSTLSCPAGASANNNIQFYLTVPTQDPDAELLTTLHQCLDEYFTKETVDVRRPEPQQCTKQYHIQDLSEIVVLTLNRFTFNIETRLSTKLDHDIEVPLTMSFKKYYKPELQNNGLFLYDLIAAAQHSGIASGGHYIAHVKDANTGMWYKCDDANITQESIDLVQAGINQSYVLVYKKNASQPDVLPVQPTAPKKPVGLIKALNQLTDGLTSVAELL
jgi:ubiquitin C-terminal hydrolase